MAYTAGKGTKLQLSISSTLTDIAQVVSMTPPSMEMGTVETTHLLSTWREYISTIPDGGSIDFTLEWDASHATHAALWTAFQGGAVETWKVLFTDTGAATVGFSGIVTGYAFDEIAVDGVVTASLSVKLTGPVVITP
ncbi:phage tail tube protein [Anatilimnocola floriformis]|uniref:phage tail tube protein n=1 Tax=Anatilimnocola floriformis TaxID=2948575 RepID=UPI0020C58D83|nr:phage tail tube protein [Anatilimnocola floriformis]